MRASREPYGGRKKGRAVTPKVFQRNFSLRDELIDDGRVGQGNQVGVAPGVIAELDLSAVHERTQGRRVLGPGRVNAVREERDANAGAPDEVEIGRHDVGAHAIVDRERHRVAHGGQPLQQSRSGMA